MIEITVKKDTVGCYGKDDQGNTWSSFQLMGYRNWATCSQCGKRIRRGMSRYRPDRMDLCVEHVNLTYEETHD